MVVLPKSDFETLDVLYVAENLALAEMYHLKLELDGYWVRVVDLDRLGILDDLRTAARRPDLPAIILAASRGQELRSQGAILCASDYVVRISSPDAQPVGRLSLASDTELP